MHAAIAVATEAPKPPRGGVQRTIIACAHSVRGWHTGHSTMHSATAAAAAITAAATAATAAAAARIRRHGHVPATPGPPRRVPALEVAAGQPLPVEQRPGGRRARRGRRGQRRRGHWARRRCRCRFGCGRRRWCRRWRPLRCRGSRGAGGSAGGGGSSRGGGSRTDSGRVGRRNPGTIAAARLGTKGECTLRLGVEGGGVEGGGGGSSTDRAGGYRSRRGREE